MTDATDKKQQLIDYLKALRRAEPEMTIDDLIKDARYVFGTTERCGTPSGIPIERLWSAENGEETVNSWGDRVWRVRDLRAAVKDQPVFDLPLALVPLREHKFDCPDIVEFARHMRHVQDADTDDPVIMDEWGWVMDGRHRIVKALIEGRESIKCVRLPHGMNPSYYKSK